MCITQCVYSHTHWKLLMVFCAWGEVYSCLGDVVSVGVYRVVGSEVNFPQPLAYFFLEHLKVFDISVSVYNSCIVRNRPSTKPNCSAPNDSYIVRGLLVCRGCLFCTLGHFRPINSNQFPPFTHCPTSP